MEFAYLCRPKLGEERCGDAVGVFGEGDRRLFAVTDGLGHGPEAESVSQKALACVGEHWSEDLEEILRRCHQHLQGTRGLALFLARFTNGASRLFECAGVGNVECKVAGAPNVAPFCREGIVGHNMRKVSAFRYDLPRGCSFAIYSDGIHGGFDLEKYTKLDAGAAARAILERWGKDYDDATILLVRPG
jgi:hypothetical protein